MLDQMVETEAGELLRNILDRAKEGDRACALWALDRVWPARKGRLVDLGVPPLKTSEDVRNAIIFLWNAVADGRITPDEANALSLCAERSLQVINQQDLLKRVEELEKDREERDGKADFETP
jgi:hypothetical protein